LAETQAYLPDEELAALREVAAQSGKPAADGMLAASAAVQRAADGHLPCTACPTECALTVWGIYE
jgi:hypothetical protein